MYASARGRRDFERAQRDSKTEIGTLAIGFALKIIYVHWIYSYEFIRKRFMAHFVSHAREPLRAQQYASDGRHGLVTCTHIIRGVRDARTRPVTHTYLQINVTSHDAGMKASDGPTSRKFIWKVYRRFEASKAAQRHYVKVVCEKCLCDTLFAKAPQRQTTFAIWRCRTRARVLLFKVERAALVLRGGLGVVM